MKIVIKDSGFKVKIKISNYELFKLNLTPDELKELIKASLRVKERVA